MSLRALNYYGESGDVDQDIIESHLPSLQNFLSAYDNKNIFNADVCRLQYKMKPDRDISTRPLSGRKKKKDSFTVFVCCNADDSEKVSWFLLAMRNVQDCLNGSMVNITAFIIILEKYLADYFLGWIVLIITLDGHQIVRWFFLLIIDLDTVLVTRCILYFIKQLAFFHPIRRLKFNAVMQEFLRQWKLKTKRSQWNEHWILRKGIQATYKVWIF